MLKSPREVHRDGCKCCLDMTSQMWMGEKEAQVVKNEDHD